MKINFLQILIAISILMSSFSTLASVLSRPDETMDSILLEVNHSDARFQQLTQAELNVVKNSGDADLKVVYFNTRFFILSYWSTGRAWSAAQKAHLTLFFRGLHNFATSRQTPPEIMQNFCRYSTGQGSASVYGSYHLNSRWSNYGEDFNRAWSIAETAYQLQSEGIVCGGLEIARYTMQGVACDYVRSTVSPSELTGFVCGVVANEAGSAIGAVADSAARTVAGRVTRAADNVLCRERIFEKIEDGLNGTVGLAQFVAWRALGVLWSDAIGGMANEVQGAARDNIRYATTALRQCIMVGGGEVDTGVVIRERRGFAGQLMDSVGQIADEAGEIAGEIADDVHDGRPVTVENPVGRLSEASRVENEGRVIREIKVRIVDSD